MGAAFLCFNLVSYALFCIGVNNSENSVELLHSNSPT